MPGLGLIVNIVAIIVGSLIGVAVGSLIKESMRASIIQVQGVAVIVIGAMVAISALLELSQSPGALGRFSLVVFLVCLIVGTLIGEILKIEDRLKAMGEALQKRVQGKRTKAAIEAQEEAPAEVSAEGTAETPADTPSENTEKSGKNKFVQGFITASLVYCVGAMAIIGSIQDGLGNPDILLVKAVLDGTISLFFASTLGIGVLFSIIPLFILQGAIALVAFAVGDVIPLVAITGVEAVGGVLILAIGLNLATGLKLRVGNMIPAVFVALAVVWIMAEVLPF